MAIAEDASQPSTVQRAAGTGTTVVTASFSPPANSLLMVQCVIGWGSAASGTPTVSCSDSAAGSYTPGPTVKNVSATPTSQGALFYRYLSSAPGSMTVTCTSSSSTSKAMLLRVRVLTGVDSVTPNGATATLTSSKTTSLTTTVAGSMVYCVGGDGTSSTMTVVSGTTSTGTDLWSDPISGDNMAIGRSTSATVTPGSTAFGWSAPAGGIFAGLEIRPAAAGQSIAVGQSTETDTANAVTWPRIRAIGQATETDTGNTLVPFRPPPQIGQAASAETANTITPFGPTAAFNAAVDDTDRTITHRVLADWDRDGLYNHTLSDITGWVTDLTVDRAATGDLPTEATLVEGAIAATLRVTLGGIDPDTGLEVAGSDGLSAMDVFAPYREDSPLYLLPVIGCGVTVDIGLVTDTGPQLVRQFTGQIRSLAPSSGTRTVTLSALDGADLLRAPITLPAYSLARSDVLNSNHRMLVNTQAVVDFVLRKNGIYASPPAKDDAQISCTAHGWLAAEVGRSAVPRGIAGVTAADSWWTDGPFGMLAARGDWAAPGAYQEFFSRERYAPVSGTGFGMGIWVRLSNALGVSGDTRGLLHAFPGVDATWGFKISVYGNGRIGARIDSGAGEGDVVTAAASSGTLTWTYIGVHFAHRADDTTLLTIRRGGSTGTATFSTPGIVTSIGARLQATVFTPVDWACMQIWYGAAAPATWPGETHTPQATLDRGLNEMSFLPDVVEKDSLEVIKAAVGAEYGLFGYSETGSPFFRSRSTSTDPTTVDKTISADKALIDLATEVNVDTVRNAVSTETVSGYLDPANKIIEARDVTDWQTPVGVWTYEVALPWGAIGTTTQTVPHVASASWTDTTLNGFVSVQAASPATEIATGVSVTFTMIGDRRGLLTVRNYSAFPVRFATTSGSPALRVQGWLVEKEPAVLEQITADGSIALYGKRIYKLDANDWRQLNAQLRTVAGGLLTTLANPMPVIPNVPAVGDPRLQLGDVVRLVDPAGQGSFRAYVVRIAHTLDKGLRTELTVRPVASPGIGILDDTELGILDDTLILAP